MKFKMGSCICEVNDDDVKFCENLSRPSSGSVLSDEYVDQMNEYRLFADKPNYDKYSNMSEALRILYNQFIVKCTEEE